MRPAHTPYDGSAIPFSIGLKPIDPDDWIEVDDALPAYLDEKRRLYAEMPDIVFMAGPDTRESQQEVLDTLAHFLPKRFPKIYKAEGGTVAIAGTSGPVQLSGWPDAPLLAASLLVQEDLVLMRASPQGWRLVAASLCFPSSWTLAEKFGRPLDEIHRPIPEFGAGTRMAGLIARIFNNLKPDQPVERHNWSLTTKDDLYLPVAEAEKTGAHPSTGPRFGAIKQVAGAFIRVERQTLRCMPLSGDILFTIRIHVDPMRVLLEHPRRAELAAGFADQLASLTPAQIGYKRIVFDRDNLVETLRMIARDQN